VNVGWGRVLHVVLASALALLALRNVWFLAEDRTRDATPAFGFALLVLVPLTLLSVSVHLIRRRRVRQAWDKLELAISLAQTVAALGILACLLV
jgi:hypothetical protein